MLFRNVYQDILFNLCFMSLFSQNTILSMKDTGYDLDSEVRPIARTHVQPKISYWYINQGAHICSRAITLTNI